MRAAVGLGKYQVCLVNELVGPSGEAISLGDAPLCRSVELTAKEVIANDPDAETYSFIDDENGNIVPVAQGGPGNDGSGSDDGGVGGDDGSASSNGQGSANSPAREIRPGSGSAVVSLPATGSSPASPGGGVFVILAMAAAIAAATGASLSRRARR